MKIFKKVRHPNGRKYVSNIDSTVQKKLREEKIKTENQIKENYML